MTASKYKGPEKRHLKTEELRVCRLSPKTIFKQEIVTSLNISVIMLSALCRIGHRPIVETQVVCVVRIVR